MAYAIHATQPGGTEVLARQEFEPTPLQAGELQIEHRAIGVNFIDVYIRTGAYPWPVEENLILGSEAAGVVSRIGANISGFKEGDCVAYTLPNGAGLIAGQWLAAKGATAIGTAGTDEKCATAMQNGYSDVINYKTDDFLAGVKAYTEGEMVDVVYDSVGKTTWPSSRDCLKRHGTMVSFGQSSGPIENLEVIDLAVGSLYLTRPTLFHFTADRSWLENASAALFDMIASGRINIPINQIYSLDQADEAHNALESRATTGCTILLP